MHSLPELKRLNALHMDEVQYPRLHSVEPRLHSVEPRLHPLVAASIASIEAQRPLSKIVAKGGRVAVTPRDVLNAACYCKTIS